MAKAKARGWLRSKKPKLSSIQEKHLVKLFQEGSTPPQSPGHREAHRVKRRSPAPLLG